MGRITTIDLFKEDQKFSAGHFTIFSANKRENLHGHNFTVHVSMRTEVLQNGLCFDYGWYKRRIAELCREWNEVTLLPSRSAYLTIEDDGDYIAVRFAAERLLFLRRDVLLLPIENVTLEELSQLFLEKMLNDPSRPGAEGLHGITVKVFSGPGQCASASWPALES